MKSYSNDQMSAHEIEQRLQTLEDNRQRTEDALNEKLHNECCVFHEKVEDNKDHIITLETNLQNEVNKRIHDIRNIRDSIQYTHKDLLNQMDDRVACGKRRDVMYLLINIGCSVCIAVGSIVAYHFLPL